MSPASRQALMDELLRGAIPEIKLGLGEAIDRENARPLPPRYARLLPETLLVVTLRPDAADALEPIATELEQELTNSCTRHGSLYDRAYCVRLQRSGDHDAPLYVVSAHAGKDIGGRGAALSKDERSDAPVADGADDAEEGQGTPSPSQVSSGSLATRRTMEGVAQVQSPDEGEPAYSANRHMPMSSGEMTRDPGRSDEGWHPGRWVLVVESAGGEEREVFRISQPLVTVGRRTDDPSLRAAIAISDAPSVSRRQMALEWEDRDGAAGFRVYNLGLNPLYIPGRDIPGSRSGKTATALDRIGEEFIGWLPPGVPMRIGDQGPTLRIEEVPVSDQEIRDDEATVYE